jgi:hypothetical protein
MATKRKRTKRPSRDAILASPARARALEALSRMRTEALSLAKASRRADTTPKTVVKFAGGALTKNTRGRYEAKPSDRLARVMIFYTEGGPIEVTIKSSKKASEISRHMSAIKLFLAKGDASGLAEFGGKTIKSHGTIYYYGQRSGCICSYNLSPVVI